MPEPQRNECTIETRFVWEGAPREIGSIVDGWRVTWCQPASVKFSLRGGPQRTFAEEHKGTESITTAGRLPRITEINRNSGCTARCASHSGTAIGYENRAWSGYGAAGSAVTFNSLGRSRRILSTKLAYVPNAAKSVTYRF